jgi:hypothetical protein
MAAITIKVNQLWNKQRCMHLEKTEGGSEVTRIFFPLKWFCQYSFDIDTELLGTAVADLLRGKHGPCWFFFLFSFKIFLQKKNQISILCLIQELNIYINGPTFFIKLLINNVKQRVNNKDLNVFSSKKKRISFSFLFFLFLFPVLSRRLTTKKKKMYLEAFFKHR